MQTFLLVSAVLVTHSDGLLSDTVNYFKSNEYDGGNPDTPLFLSPFIKNGQLEEARNLSVVSHPKFQNVKSFAGYFTVNEIFNSNLFFWFFPAERDYDNAPVLLWLQGGPGDSSLFGLFVENGPLEIKSGESLRIRNYRWTKECSIIYIDNPAGTGFSFTSSSGRCRSQAQVGAELYEALQQFFILFPNLQKNEFFVAGESYGGKYTTAVAYTIHKLNSEATLKINLKGVAIDSGLVDPANQIQYADYLYQTGFIDAKTKLAMEMKQLQVKRFVRSRRWTSAWAEWVSIIELFRTQAGFSNLYNYLQPVDPTEKLKNFLSTFLQTSDIRAAIHVGRTNYDGGSDTYSALTSDIMQSVAPWLTELLNNYRVLIYNGQVDVIVAYPLTLNYLENLEFNSASEYKRATRKQWKVRNEIAGYVKVAGNLTEVLVRDAGHLIAYDQPEWAYHLVSKFLRNVPIT